MGANDRTDRAAAVALDRKLERSASTFHTEVGEGGAVVRRRRALKHRSRVAATSRQRSSFSLRRDADWLSLSREEETHRSLARGCESRVRPQADPLRSRLHLSSPRPSTPTRPASKRSRQSRPAEERQGRPRGCQEASPTGPPALRACALSQAAQHPSSRMGHHSFCAVLAAPTSAVQGKVAVHPPTYRGPGLGDPKCELIIAWTSWQCRCLPLVRVQATTHL
jgi:hypothetical protein